MFSIGLDCTECLCIYEYCKLPIAILDSNVKIRIKSISVTFSIFLKKNAFTLHKPFNVSHHIPVKMISDQKGIFAVLKIELLIMDDNFKIKIYQTYSVDIFGWVWEMKKEDNVSWLSSQGITSMYTHIFICTLLPLVSSSGWRYDMVGR